MGLSIADAQRLYPSGVSKVIIGTNPAAGTEIVEAVPADKVWVLKNMLFTFATDATAITRRVKVIVDDGTDANIAFRLDCSQSQLASLTYNYNFVSGGHFNNSLAGAVVLASLPSECIMLGGWRVRTSTDSIQAADDFTSAPKLWVIEYPRSLAA